MHVYLKETDMNREKFKAEQQQLQLFQVELKEWGDGFVFVKTFWTMGDKMPALAPVCECVSV